MGEGKQGNTQICIHNIDYHVFHKQSNDLHAKMREF